MHGIVRNAPMRGLHDKACARGGKQPNTDLRPRDLQGAPRECELRRLAMELQTREGPMGIFHAGAT